VHERRVELELEQGGAGRRRAEQRTASALENQRPPPRLAQALRDERAADTGADDHDVRASASLQR